MYLDTFVCPECNTALSPHSQKCYHCNHRFSHPRHTTVFRWHWLDRFFLFSLTLILTCFFMPWFSGEFLYQDAPFSAYAMLTQLVDLEIDLLASYDILRMSQIVPIFAVFLFLLIYLEETLRQSPFPGIFLFILLTVGGWIQLCYWFSGVYAYVAITLFLALLIYYYRKHYIEKSIGDIVYNQLIAFLSISMLVYYLDLHARFYSRLSEINILDTWGFWISAFFCAAMTLLMVLRNIRCRSDFWLTGFIAFFSISAYLVLVKPMFFTGTFLFLADNTLEITRALSAHIKIVGIALGNAIIIGVPVGVYITRHPAAAGIVLYISSILITIPSIAMFGFMMPILSSLDNAWDAVNGIGIGVVPAVVALSLYSLLPIVRNTYIALNSVDPATMEAGRGMGMTGFQLLIQLQLPLAAPIIMAGVRTAVVMGIAIAAIAAYIGAGGLGVFVSKGLQMSTNASVIAGALIMSLLAIVADILLARAEDWITPDGLKIEAAPD